MIFSTCFKANSKYFIIQRHQHSSLTFLKILNCLLKLVLPFLICSGHGRCNDDWWSFFFLSKIQFCDYFNFCYVHFNFVILVTFFVMFISFFVIVVFCFTHKRFNFCHIVVPFLVIVISIYVTVVSIFVTPNSIFHHLQLRLLIIMTLQFCEIN